MTPADFRYTSNTLPSYGLAFGKRTVNAQGVPIGTDQARFRQQATVHSDPVFGHVMRAECAVGDTAQWAPASAANPCAILVGDLGWRARVGDSGVFHIVMDFTACKGNQLGWELHNTNSVASTIAPFGILNQTPNPKYDLCETFANGKIVGTTDYRTAIVLRVATGSVPAGGGGQSYWHPCIVIPGLQPVPAGFIHFLLGATNFSSSGSVWLKAWKHGDPVPAAPQISLSGIPTNVWTGSTFDALYPQWGAYGYPTGTDVIQHAGWTFRATEAEALKDFPLGSVTPPPPPPPPPVVDPRDLINGALTEWKQTTLGYEAAKAANPNAFPKTHNGKAEALLLEALDVLD